jgi:hypothetical protein
MIFGFWLTHFIPLQITVTAKSFLKKLLAAHIYRPAGKIDANVLLIKPTENYAKLSNDYGLTEVKKHHKLIK